MKKNTKAIILAAGMGNRMRQLTHSTPKSLLEVNSRPLIGYAIDFVRDIGIQEVVVVGGYLFEQLEKKIKAIDEAVFVVNNMEYSCQNLTSFARGLESLKEENILTCDSDYIFSKDTSHAISKNMNGITVYCSYDVSKDTDDVMKVKVGHQGNVVRMSKDLTDFECIYTGVFFIGSEYIDLIKRIVNKNLEINKPEARVESIFDMLVVEGHDIRVVDVGKADWFEIDTPEELEIAKQALK